MFQRAFRLVSATALSILASAGCGDHTGAGPEVAYRVVMAVTSDSGIIGAIQFQVDYLGHDGDFIGSGGTIDCGPLVDALFASNNPPGRSMAGGVITLEGFETPADIVECGFRTSGALAPDDFRALVTDASHPDLTPVVPKPAMAVVRVTPAAALSESVRDDAVRRADALGAPACHAFLPAAIVRALRPAHRMALTRGSRGDSRTISGRRAPVDPVCDVYHQNRRGRSIAIPSTERV